MNRPPLDPPPLPLPQRLLLRGVDGTLLFLVVFTPLAFGGVEPWAIAVIEAGALIATLLWFLERNRYGEPAVAGGAICSRSELLGRAGLVTTVGAFLGIVLLQLVPLPPPVLRVASPTTHRLYQSTLPGYEDGRGVDFNRVESWLMGGSRATASGDVAPPTWGESPQSDLIFTDWRTLSLVPAATRRYLALFLAFLLVFVVTKDRARDPVFRHRLLWGVAFMGVLVAMLGLAQATTWGDRVYGRIRPAYGGSPMGPFVNRNHFAGYLELAVAVLAGLWMRHLRRERDAHGMRPAQTAGRTRSLAQAEQKYVPQLFMISILLAAGLLALAQSGSRGGIVAAGATLVVFVTLALGRSGAGRKGMILGAAVVLLAVAFVGWRVHTWTRERSLESGLTTEPSFGQRLRVWQASVGMLARFPVLGTGLGTYGYAIPLYQGRGYERLWIYAHNDYVQLACETGLLGAAVFGLGFAFFSRRALLPVLLRPIERGGQALGCAAGVLSLLIHSLVDFNLQIPSNGLLFVILGAVLVALQPTATASTSAASPVPMPRGPARRSVAATLVAGFAFLLALLPVGASAFARYAQDTATELFWTGRPAEAREHLKRALWTGARLPDVQADLGFFYLRVVRDREGAGKELGMMRAEALALARGAFCRAINLNPINTNPWSGLAEVYLEAEAEDLRRRVLDISEILDMPATGSFYDALYLATLRKMMALEPPNPFLHARLGDYFWERGNRQSALRAYEDAVRLLPRIEEHAFLASQGTAPENLQAAIRGLERALAEGASGLPAHLLHNNLSILWDRAGDTRAAISHIEQACVLLPEFKSYRIMLGFLLFKAGELERSQEILLKCVEEGVRNQYVYLHLAMISARQGKSEEALNYYRRALAVNPENGRVVLALARQYEELRDLRRAQAHYEKCVDLMPNDVSVLLAVVDFHVRRGVPGAAIPLMRRVVTLEPGQEVYRQRLEQLLARTSSLN